MILDMNSRNSYMIIQNMKYVIIIPLHYCYAHEEHVIHSYLLFSELKMRRRLKAKWLDKAGLALRLMGLSQYEAQDPFSHAEV